jgi:hypothetical protein
MAIGFNKKRNEFGVAQERKLEKFIQTFFEEPITPTEKTFATKDWTTSERSIELKSRTDKYTSESFDTWLCPVCKIQEGIPFTLFYYYLSDGTIWKWDYEGDYAIDFKTEFPRDWSKPGGRSTQIHYLIPKEVFQLVGRLPPADKLA